MDTSKPAYLSKTLWTNAIMAVLALAWPTGSAFVVAHPDLVVILFTVVNMILRLVTKDQISLV